MGAAVQKGREKTRKNQLLVLVRSLLSGPVFNFILRIFVCKNETKGKRKRKGGDDDYEEEEGKCENSHGKEN